MIKIGQHSRKKLYALFCALLFFKIMGLAPFWINIPQLVHKSRCNNEKVFTTSNFGSIYNCALIGCIIFTDFLMSNNTKREVSAFVVKLPRIIGKFLTVTAFLLGIFIWFLYIVRQKRIVSLANKLLDIDEIMFKCTGLHQKFPKPIIFKSLMHLSISIYLLAAEVSTQHTSILTLIIFVCPSIIISWTIVQYSLVLHLVDERIANVNKSLLKIGKIPVDLEMPSVFIRKTPVDASGQITTIRRVDVELCNFCYKIRDFYALPTLMTVTFFGSSLVYSSYFLAMPLVTRSNHHLHLTYINGCAWLALQISSFLILTTSVTKITRTVKKTANIVHLLLDNCALPSESLAELKGFSRQVLMKNFHLSVYDMFPLDNSLLGSIAGVVMTNLIILIQFSIE